MMIWALLTLQLGMNTTLRRSPTWGSLLMTSPTELINLMMRLAFTQAGAALPPNITLRACTLAFSSADIFRIRRQRWMMQRMLRNCLLYSWMRFTITSNNEFGFRSTLQVYLIHDRRRSLLSCLIAMNSSWNLASDASSSNARSLSMSKVQSSEARTLSYKAANLGFAHRIHLHVRRISNTFWE